MTVTNLIAAMLLIASAVGIVVVLRFRSVGESLSAMLATEDEEGDQ